MAEKLFIFEEESFADEFVSLLEELGIKWEKVGNVVKVNKIRDEELLYVFSELSEEALKSLRFYEGNVNISSCESLLKAVVKAKTPDVLIDKLIYNEIGKIFIDTKIVFHPIVDVKKKEVAAFEALCRPPIKIVDLINVGKSTAEFSENFCRYEAMKRAKEFLGNRLLFLNFHPRFLKDPLKTFGDFLTTVYMHEIDPSQIVVELTEYEELDITAVRSLISFLKSEGVKVALDDVGSGYSGLFYLSELGPDIIKIDMELIRNIHKHSLKKIIVNYLIRIAHESGIKVVSEGVERPEELETVLYMETDYVQGFIFTKPVEKPDVKRINERVRKVLNAVNGLKGPDR
ncbi:EAL domain-containing protein [Aquifex pyrophilus]